MGKTLRYDKRKEWFDEADKGKTFEILERMPDEKRISIYKNFTKRGHRGMDRNIFREKSIKKYSFFAGRWKY